jgi:hypothetical protein
MEFMRKFTGWLLIVACSIFLLVFTLALILIFPGLFKSNSNVHMSISEIIGSSLGFGTVILLLVFGLISGINRVKKDKVIDVVEYTGKLNITLTGKIAYKDYRDLIFGLSFKKPVYLILLVVMILYLLTIMNNGVSKLNHPESNYFVFIFLGFAILSPILTFIQINKSYKSNRIFQEHLEYFLNNEFIQIKGETVDSIQRWTHFFKIKETKKFIMLYQGEIVATLLDKNMFNPGDLAEFRRFILSLKMIRE